MNKTKNSPLQDFFRIVLTVIVLIATLPLLMQWVLPVAGKNLASSVQTGTIVPPNTASQLSAPGQKSWTHEEWVLKDFPDLKQFTSEAQYSAIMDRRVPERARSLMIGNAMQRKTGEPSMYDDTRRHWPVLPIEESPNFMSFGESLLRYTEHLKESRRNQERENKSRGQFP